MIAVTGGKMFDSTKGVFVPNPGIRIDGAHIAQVGGEMASGGKTFDATGKTVMPGLFNLHGHFAWDGFSDLEAQCRYDGPLGYVKASRGLISAVQAGITTFRDLACVHDTGLVAKRAVRDGLIPGPKVYAAGRAVCRTGGHIWFGNREADGVAEVLAAVREQIKQGADWIKLMAHGYSRAEIQAVVDQAHDQGIPVTTDAGDWVELAVDAGVDCIEHGGNYSDELIAKIVDRGIWIVPTLSPVVRQARYGAEWGMQQSVIDRRKRQLSESGRHEGIRRARQAGAKLAFGTDSGSPVVPHDAVFEEMEALLEFGIFESEAEVLQAATIRAAECLRIEEDSGSLEAGKHADIAILDGDLEADLEVIRNVETVFVDGRLTVEGGRAILPDPRDFQSFANVGA